MQSNAMKPISCASISNLIPIQMSMKCTQQQVQPMKIPINTQSKT
jgi:hypothetical protein